MDKIDTKTMLGLTTANSFPVVLSKIYGDSDEGISQLNILAKNLQEEELTHVLLYTAYLQAFDIRIETLSNQMYNGENYNAFNQIVWVAKYGDGVCTRQLRHALKELWIGNYDVIKDCRQMGGSFMSSLFVGDMDSSFGYADESNKRALIEGFCNDNNRDEQEMQKVLNKYDSEEMYFNYWMHSGNVVECKDGSFSTQDSQYRNKFVGIAMLKEYYNREIAFDSSFETDTEFIKETLIDLITPLIRDTHNEQDVEDLQHMNLEELQNIHNELSVDIVNDNDNRIHKNSYEYQSQFETETERLEREEEEEWISEDEIAKRNPNKFRKPNEDLLCDMEAQIEGHNVKEVTVIIDGEEFILKGFKKPSENTIGLYQQEINDVTILALETLREQVRDANDNYNHFRVNKVLKFYKNKF